jgi:DNA-binding CsgD family transcriptional regulator
VGSSADESLTTIASALESASESAGRQLPVLLSAVARLLYFDRMIALGFEPAGRGWKTSFLDSYGFHPTRITALRRIIDAHIRDKAELPIIDQGSQATAGRVSVARLPTIDAPEAPTVDHWSEPHAPPSRACLTDVLEQAIACLGIAGTYCAHGVVDSGLEVSAWIGGFRGAPIEQAACAGLEQILAPLRERLIRERRCGITGAAVSPLSLSAIEHLAGIAFVLDEGDRILATNRAGRIRYRLDPSGVRSQIREIEGIRIAPPDTCIGLSQSDRPTLRLVVLPNDNTRAELARRFVVEHRMTRQQGEVLALLVNGMSNRAIARTLNRSERTVEAHVAAIFARLNCDSRVEAIVAVLGSGESRTPEETASAPR